MTASHRFADVYEAARDLSAVVPDRLAAEIDVVVALGEPAMPIADAVASSVGSAAGLVPVTRGEAPVIGVVPECSGLCVMVVDRGVETGQSAMSAARALREAGAACLILAVAVCPRQAESVLVRAYDEIIAIHRPLGRRSLQWHYSSPLE